MIKLIVGLRNPGPAYEKTRHNAGAWFVESLASAESKNFKVEKKFLSELALHEQCQLLLPSQYMNQSGQATSLAAKYFKLKPEELLIAHDELDLPAGAIKLKLGGGHGGHNGLRDIIKALGSNQCHRLRIGIGHPGHKDDVHDYVLSKPSKADKKLIDDAIERGLSIIPPLLRGDTQRAMLDLHS